MVRISSLAALLCALFSMSAQADEVKKCLEIQNSDQRLACYDSAFGYSQPVVSVEKPVRKTNDNSAVPADVVPSAVTTKAQQAYDQVIADSKSMVITKVGETRRGQLYFFTDKGRTFKRLTDRNLTLKVGQVVRLEKGLLSAIFLVAEDGPKIKVSEIK